MSRWFRHYAGMMRDEKLVRVAIKSRQTVERVVWVWGAILESASEINDDGRYDLDPAEAAYFLRADETDVACILAALESLDRLCDGRVVKWGDRQFSSDSSAERQRRHRDRKRNVTDDNGDGEVTSLSRHGDAPETETEEEAEKKEVKAASAPPKTPPSTASSDDYPDELDAAVSAYNTAAEACKWPTCQRLTSPRIRHLTARLAEVGGIDGWRLAMERASKSSFLRGETGRSGQHSNWRCDLDFLLQQSSFTKLMEGKYDDAPRLNGQHGQPQPGHRTPGQTERDRQLAIALAGAGVGRV